MLDTIVNAIVERFNLRLRNHAQPESRLYELCINSDVIVFQFQQDYVFIKIYQLVHLGDVRIEYADPGIIDKISLIIVKSTSY